MPPKLGENVIDYVDLDIDVIVWPDGRQMTLDLEEFYVNCNAFEYPDDVKSRALEELNAVQAGARTLLSA